MHSRQVYIDGAWQDPKGTEVIEVFNPATEKKIGEVIEASPADVDAAVDAARRAFKSFSRSSVDERIGWLERLLEAFEARKADIAKALSEEMGCPITAATNIQAASGPNHIKEMIRVLREFEFDELSGPTGGNATFDPAAGWDATQVGTDGAFPFSAAGDTAGLYRLEAGAYNTAAAADPYASTVVNLDVSGQTADNGSIAAEELNLVTGADNRAGFGQSSNSAQVRPDQATVTFEIKDATVNNNGTPADTSDDFISQRNRVVSLTATGAGVTFGGQGTQTRTVTLDAQGRGSVTFNVDAASIADGESFTVDGAALANPFTVNYESPAVSNSTVDADQDTYISSFGGTVNPVFTVKDQYGNPVSGVYVTYELEGGPNDTNTESSRVITDETKAEMRKILTEIQKGEFAREFINETRTGSTVLKATARHSAEHPIEAVGAKLRGMMPWIAANQLVDKTKN